MQKIQSIGGLEGKTKEWIKDYLDGREMRTVVRDEKSQCRRVTSGVPQGLALAPIVFLMYVNDMPQGINSYISLFANDANWQRKIQKENGCKALQKDLHTFYEWSRIWDMAFNNKKLLEIPFILFCCLILSTVILCGFLHPSANSNFWTELLVRFGFCCLICN